MAYDRADHRRLNPVSAFGAALRGLPAAWAGAWGILIFASLLILAPPMAGVLAVLHGMALFLAGLAAWGALNRIALDRRAGLGGGGIQFGAGELRMAWGLVLNLIFLAMIFTVVALVCLAVFGASGLDLEALRARRVLESGPAWKLAVLGVVGLIGAGVPLLLAVRLSLFGPASIGRGRTVALNSMGIAAGAFWPLAGLWLVIVGAAGGLAWGLAAAGLDPWGARLVAAVVVPWLWGAASAGLLADAYRQLEYWTPS